MRPLLLGLLLSIATGVAPAAHRYAAGERATVEVYDRTAGVVLPQYRHGGRTWIAGEAGHEYELRLRNRGDGRLLAVTSVDGVNVVTGETASPAQGGYVLDPWEQASVDGWRKSLDHVARFYFTALPDSYAARTGRPFDVGVIGVALFEERRAPWRPWRGDDFGDGAAERHESAPSAASPEAQAGAKSHRDADERLGTGHGREDWSPVATTGFTRASRGPAEIVAIHYDSRERLVARGVIPREIGWRDAPRPFPGRFVPDPWR